MSAVHHFKDGSMSEVRTTITWARWGAGAHPGMHHVFMSLWCRRTGVPLISTQCVVDDFGDLVEVAS